MVAVPRTRLGPSCLASSLTCVDKLWLEKEGQSYGCKVGVSLLHLHQHRIPRVPFTQTLTLGCLLAGATSSLLHSSLREQCPRVRRCGCAARCRHLLRAGAASLRVSSPHQPDLKAVGCAGMELKAWSLCLPTTHRSPPGLLESWLSWCSLWLGGAVRCRGRGWRGQTATGLERLCAALCPASLKAEL